jgi:hypothetical protein
MSQIFISKTMRQLPAISPNSASEVPGVQLAALQSRSGATALERTPRAAGLQRPGDAGGAALSAIKGCPGDPSQMVYIYIWYIYMYMYIYMYINICI